MSTLFIKKAGHGKIPLVLLHGWGMVSVIFEPLIPFLENTFDIFLVDLPGCGQSPWQADLTPQKTAQLIVDEIKIPAIYLGWSLGSMIALCIAHDFKQNTLAYINVAGSPAFSQHFWPFGIRVDALTQFALQLQSTPEQVRRDFLDLHLRNSALNPAEIKDLAEKINETLPTPESLIATTFWLKTVDLRPLWKALQVPTLSILGDRDKLLPIAAAAHLTALNPHTGMHIMKKTSHLPFLHDKMAFSQKIIEFVSHHGL